MATAFANGGVEVLVRWAGDGRRTLALQITHSSTVMESRGAFDEEFWIDDFLDLRQEPGSILGQAKTFSTLMPRGRHRRRTTGDPAAVRAELLVDGFRSTDFGLNPSTPTSDRAEAF